MYFIDFKLFFNKRDDFAITFLLLSEYANDQYVPLLVLVHCQFEFVLN